MKKKILFSISVVILLVIFSMAINKFILKNNDNDNNIPISITNYTDIIENKDGYYYFGRPDCLSCKKFQKELNNVLKENKKYKIYYINTSYWKNKNDAFNQLLVDYNIDSVPLIIKYQNNNEISRYYYDENSDNKNEFKEFIKKGE